MMDPKVSIFFILECKVLHNGKNGCDGIADLYHGSYLVEYIVNRGELKFEIG